MTIRKFLAALLALSVAFAPAAALAADAPAAAHHHAQLMEAGHCAAVSSASPAKSQRHDASAKDCCMAMCVAVAITSTRAAEGGMAHGLSATSPAPAFLIGLPAEIATPPPRGA